MTTAATKTPFRAIFPATITPATIERLTSKTGKPYIKMVGATYSKEGKPDVIRTAMAFGKSADAIDHLLVEGKPVRLAVQTENGTIRIIGEVLPPRQAAAA